MHETLEEAVKAPFHSLSSVIKGLSSSSPRERTADDRYVWALQDVSFEVSRGEVVGIIGKNGAGKSVLLKILSRITKPATGYAEIHGRVGSILEVGAGFHPELTGRENIYLNGTILGMKRAEISRKFDEIVAFSEVEKFLDTPLKHYSSGMNVRLAFAVAAHLDSEIMLIDEVLAVGDESFQQKCLKKVQEVATEGRTVLFVSHDMKVIENLCARTILLSEGRIHMDGDTQEVVSHYLANARAHDDS
jgi:lipopolysaccharide transport system ATP-binding protein